MSEDRPREEYVEPTSLKEAMARRGRLIQDIRDIELELARRKRRTLDPQYLAWRSRALSAIDAKQKNAHRLRVWIRDAHLAGIREGSDGGQPALRRLARSGLAPTDLAAELRYVTGYLYALYVAVGQYLDDPDATEDELEEKYETLREFLGDDAESRMSDSVGHE